MSTGAVKDRGGDAVVIADLARRLTAFLAEHEGRDELATGCEDLPGGGYRVLMVSARGGRQGSRP